MEQKQAALDEKFRAREDRAREDRAREDRAREDRAREDKLSPAKFIDSLPSTISIIPIFKTNVSQSMLMFRFRNRRKLLHIMEIDPPVYLLLLQASPSHAVGVGEKAMDLQSAYVISKAEERICPGQVITLIPVGGDDEVKVVNMSAIPQLRSLVVKFDVIPLEFTAAERALHENLLSDANAMVLDSRNVQNSAWLLSALFARLLKELMAERAGMATGERLQNMVWQHVTPLPFAFRGAIGSSAAILDTSAELLGRCLFPYGSSDLPTATMGTMLKEAIQSSVDQDDRGVVHFNPVQRFVPLFVVDRLTRFELGVLSLIKNLAQRSSGLDVMIMMHGSIRTDGPLITAPACMCVNIIRTAATGCVSAGSFVPAYRQSYYDNLKGLKAADTSPGSNLLYKSQVDQLLVGRDEREEREKARRKLRPDDCLMAACPVSQKMFNKHYSTDTSGTDSLICILEPLLMHVDVFPIMKKCGFYNRGEDSTTRMFLLDFFKALGATGVVLHDQSCSIIVTRLKKKLRDEEEEAFVRAHAHVLGGNRNTETRAINIFK